MGGKNSKEIILSDVLNRKKLKEEGHKFTVTGIVVLSKDIDQEDLEEYKQYEYEMIYGNGNPVLIKSDAPLELRKKVLAAALSYSFMVDSVDKTMEKYIEVVE